MMCLVFVIMSTEEEINDGKGSAILGSHVNCSFFCASQEFNSDWSSIAVIFECNLSGVSNIAFKEGVSGRGVDFCDIFHLYNIS